MGNYILMRFVKLNLYFFAMYSALTSVWYYFTGRFDANTSPIFREILITSAIFSLAFSLLVLVWYRRTSILIPVKSLSKKALQQKIEAAGFMKVDAKGTQPFQIFKPVPPKASAMAGKIFIQQNINFYQIQGPKKFLKQLKEQ